MPDHFLERLISKKQILRLIQAHLDQFKFSELHQYGTQTLNTKTLIPKKLKPFNTLKRHI